MNPYPTDAAGYPEPDPESRAYPDTEGASDCEACGGRAGLDCGNCDGTGQTEGDDAPECPDADELRDNATITDNPRGGYVLTIEGRIFGYYDDTDAARSRFLDWCERERCWPALYEVNDHGNVTLLDPSTGAHLRGWV